MSTVSLLKFMSPPDSAQNELSSVSSLPATFRFTSLGTAPSGGTFHALRQGQELQGNSIGRVQLDQLQKNNEIASALTCFDMDARSGCEGCETCKCSGKNSRGMPLVSVAHGQCGMGGFRLSQQKHCPYQ